MNKLSSLIDSITILKLLKDHDWKSAVREVISEIVEAFTSGEITSNEYDFLIESI